MSGMLKRLVLAGGLVVILSVALALPKEEFERKKVRSPAVDDDDFPNFEDEAPAQFSVFNLITGRAGKFISNFIQVSYKLEAD
ncbi:hypothetical protein RUM44_004933 [Polyplax serrata]|uniref:Uncharacterized protein n=1 Tax=Polyplax serrata TaxID=468196 RepID=A0ABR1AWF8_POLSC